MDNWEQVDIIIHHLSRIDRPFATLPSIRSNVRYFPSYYNIGTLEDSLLPVKINLDGNNNNNNNNKANTKQAIQAACGWIHSVLLVKADNKNSNGSNNTATMMGYLSDLPNELIRYGCTNRFPQRLYV